MKKKTKFLLSLTSALLVAGNALALTGCGEGGVSGVVTGDYEVVAYNGEKVTINFYHSMGSALQDYVADCVKDFKAIYPNIDVKPTYAGNYDACRDKVATELASRRGPSLVACYPDHVSLYNTSGTVLPLDDFIKSDLKVAGTEETVGLSQAQLDDYVDYYYEEGKIFGDNKMYTLPLMKSTELLYYNATYFKENNLKVPTTWDEMEATCKTILEKETANENKCIPLGYDSGANWFITMTEQLKSGYTSDKKGDHFQFNNETNRAFVERFRTWKENQYVTTQDIFGSYTSNLFKETSKEKTKVYMCIGSSAGATYQVPTATNKVYPFEVGVAMIPQIDVESPKMIQQGPSICLFKKKNTQETAAAWLFAKFITTNIRFQANVSMKNGYTSAIKSVLDNEVYAGEEFLANVQTPIYKNEELGIEYYGNLNLQAAAVKLTMDFATKQGKDGTSYYYVSPTFVGSSKARDMMNSLMKDALTYPLSGKSAAQVIKGLFDDAEKQLKTKYN